VKILNKLVISVAVFVLVHSSVYSALERALPEDNLAYPVLVTINSGSDTTFASGFFLNTAKSVYFVTARHVLYDPQGKLRAVPVELISHAKKFDDVGKTRLLLDIPSLTIGGSIVSQPTHDVAVIKIASAEPGNGSRKLRTINGVVVLESAMEHAIVGVALQSTKTIKDVLVSNQVFVFGYPKSIGITTEPQIDPLRPLLKTGIVSGINHATQRIILDCAIYPGNSGGPVVEVTNEPSKKVFNVIGLVSQFIPFVQVWENKTFHSVNTEINNSGYAVVEPMDFVFSLLPPEELIVDGAESTPPNVTK